MKMITMSMQNRTPHHSRTMNRIGSQEGYHHLIGLSTNYCVQAGCLILKFSKDVQHFHDIKVRGLKSNGVISGSSKCNAMIHYLTEDMKQELAFYGMTGVDTLLLKYE